jgi:hypothetical protein
LLNKRGCLSLDSDAGSFRIGLSRPILENHQSTIDGCT